MKNEKLIDIKELRGRSIELLREIQQVLDAGGVKYWMDFGTLLGAVREGRSILWDGDFDLSTMEPDIAEREDLWDELRARGCDIHIDESNIAISRKGWGEGWYKADLHRFRQVENGEIEYLFGSRPEKNGAKYLFRLMSIVGLAANKASDDWLYANTPFDVICSLIIDKTKINPQTLEDLGPIRYQPGQTTSGMDFGLIHKDFAVSQSPIDNESRLGRVLYGLFSVMPQFLLTPLFLWLKSSHDKSQKLPIKRVRFPVDYFESLTALDFHDLKIMAPTDTDTYLSVIYGENWRTPKTSWDLSTDSTIDSKRGEK